MIVFLALFFIIPAAAQDYPKVRDLTPQVINKRLDNPVSSLWRILILNKYTLLNGDISTKNRASWLTRVQLALPIPLTEKLNFIMRPILPILSVPVPLANGNFSRTDGLGDINLPMFLGTSRQTGFIWALGATLLIPSSTDPALGTEKWSIGPNGVAGYVGKNLVAGVVLNDQLSFAGKSDREDLRASSLQYFAWYVHPRGWQLGLGSPTIRANWKADNNNRWTVPVGLGIGKLLKIPRMPVQVTLEASYAVVHPDTFGERWAFWLNVKRVFPALMQKPLFGR